MKGKKIIIAMLTVVMAVALSACSNSKVKGVMTGELALKEGKSTGHIYLYGEQHSVEKILEKELEEWVGYYNNEGMRDLFVELPYYTAEYLNLWMEADNDEILDQLFEDIKGTDGCSPQVKAFFKQIKEQCPKTFFHGTDVGHQWDTTGARYLNYLKENGWEDTSEYQLTVECIEQGKRFYKNHDFAYRENQMVLNFMNAFDSLENRDVMGIYGSAHTNVNQVDITGQIPCMANQLKKRYGENITSEDLTELLKITEPLRMDTITVNGKDYEAAYFGKEVLTGFKDYKSREFWRLENAYEDFKDCKKVGNVLPYSNYPMRIEEGQIFVIEYTKMDGSVNKEYHRASGEKWQNEPATVEVLVK